MRIAFDAKRYFKNTTGLGNYSRWLISGLASEPGLELLLFHADKEKVQSTIPVIGPSTIKLSKALWRVRGIVKDLVKNKVEIYHGLSNEIPFGIHKTTIKSVVTIHDLIQKRFPENYSGIDRNIYNRKLKYAQKYADVIVVPSQQSKKDLIKYYHTEADRIKVIPLGMPSIPAGLKTENEDKYILCVSGMSQRKNLVNLVKAFLNTSEHAYPLIIAGKIGDSYNRLKFLCGKTDRIKLITNPDIEQIHTLYHNALFCVYPSTFEGFGLPILEAFAHGKTVATSNISSLPEVGGDAVLYFDPDNTDSISNALNTLIHSELHRKSLEKKVLEQRKHFENHSILSQYTALYNSLV